jgi:hypothetical protein
MNSNLVICFVQVIGPFQGTCIVQILGTNDRLSRVYGPDPRNSPKIILGAEGITLNAGVLGVFGEFIAIGRPVSHAWAPLAEPLSIGNTSILIDALVDWPRGSEIIISPSDFDPHESELHTIASTEIENGQTRVHLRNRIQFHHFAGTWESYGSRRMKMQAKVGLLSRNIVIQGSGQGENSPYTTWNAPTISLKGKTRTCGNRICEVGETSLDCGADCKGPAFEYGASILVSSYSEVFGDCSQKDRCLANARRAFQGTINMSNIELRFYGQNGQNKIQNGIVLSDVGNGVANNVLQNLSFNRGYSGAVYLQESSGVVVRDSVFYRSMLPGIRVQGGSNNSVIGVLGVIAIFWNTHRGMTQVGLVKYFQFRVATTSLIVQVAHY